MSNRAAPRQPLTPFPIPQASDPTAAQPSNSGHDIIAAINASSNIASDDGALIIIESQPDFRFPLISWIFSIQRAIPASAYSISPHASPASLLAYVITMFTGLLYFNELTQRPSFTSTAAHIMNDHTLSAFFNALLDLHVPAFAINEFEANRAYFDPLAKNLCIIPNLSAASFLHDFGRLFPASIFIRLHNMMANLPANTTPASLSNSFYNEIIATVQFVTGTDVIITPAMLFGASTDTNVYQNWLRNRVDRIVTALAIRPVMTAPTIGPLPVNAIPVAINNDFNAYTWLTGISIDNLDSMLQFVRSLNEFTKVSFPQSKPLRNVVQTGSLEASRHLIFLTPVPTWSTASSRTIDDPNALNYLTTSPTCRTHETFATDIDFLAVPTIPALAPNGTNVNMNTSRLRDPDPPVDYLAAPQVVNELPPPNNLDPVPWRISAARYNRLLNGSIDHCNPACLIFTPGELVPSSLAAVITSGKIIETYDLSSVTTPLASPEILLHTTNATLVLGAIRLSHIQDAITNQTNFFVRYLANYDHTTIPQGFTRGPSDQHSLPIARLGIIAKASAAIHWWSNHFFGMTTVEHTLRPHASINFFARPLGISSDIDSPYGRTTYSKVLLWSSYRYHERTGNITTISMIPSLRPIFGTQARHVRSTHPTLRFN
jgi:hypothetical protein